MRGFLISVAIAIGLLAVIVALALWIPGVGLTGFRAWFSFAFFTVLLAAVLVRAYWRARRRMKMWLLFTTFMTIHTGAYIVLLLRVTDWSALWYILTGPTEVMIFAAIAKLWLNVMPETTGL